MKKHVAVACLLAGLFGPLNAQAATIELRTVLGLGPDINSVVIEEFQSDDTQGSFTTSGAPGPNDESVKATAGFAEGGHRLSASSSLLRPAQSDFVNFRAASFSTYTDRLQVRSSGRIEVSLLYSGAYSVTTDLADDDGFAFMAASFEIAGLQSPVGQQAFQVSDLTRNEDSFLARLLTTVEVEEGDILDITAQVSATNGSTDDITAFIEASARIEGVFSITALDGASFDEDLGIAPVPLPASLPLLIGALLGLHGLQRHRSRRRS